jgi:hypothetical protein
MKSLSGITNICAGGGGREGTHLIQEYMRLEVTLMTT